MNLFLSIPAALALIGFIVSTIVHIAALMGTKIFPEAEILHVGIFVVFFPAILSTIRVQKLRMNRSDVWKLLLLGCPSWMKKVTYVLFSYAIVNFIIFAILPKGSPQNGSMPVEVIRGFSGHWIIFYWASFAILYSRIKTKGQYALVCTTCSNQCSPFDQFCSKCGAKLSRLKD